MENKVGDNVPSQPELDEQFNALKAAIEKFQVFTVGLQKDERGATAKPHRGAETLVQKTYDIAKRYGVSVKNVPLEGMMNDLRLASQIQPFEALFTLGAQLAADTTLQAKSEFYTAFLAYYGALSKAAEHDAALATEMKEVQDEMRAVRKPRGGHGAGPDAGGSPGSTPA